MNDAEISHPSVARIIAVYRGVAILAFNILILLALLELAASVVIYVGRAYVTPPDERSRLPYYASQDWANDYWLEFAQVTDQEYQPYVTWRRRAFHGKTINIDESGIRHTPGAECNHGAYTVFAFGGSTMWGTGAPDDATIPAYLQTLLSSNKTEPVCVINFGELAYVSTQSLILLETQLQAGRVPDLVVFYDGINDVFAAYQSGQAGAHQNLAAIDALFEETQPAFVKWLSSTNTFHLAKTLVTRRASTIGWQGATYETLGVDGRQLANEIVQVYMNNYRMVAALAHAYGFEFALFWQPVLVEGNKILTPEEALFVDDMEPGLRRLFELTYEQMSETASQEDRLFYLADVFDENSSQIWIDNWHVVPQGNEIVAQNILNSINR